MYVWVSELSQAAIEYALDNGHFYSTDGFAFDALTVTDNSISIELDPSSNDIGWHTFYQDADYNPASYRTEFIGLDGTVLAVDESYGPSYTCQEDDLYVRAMVRNSDGFIAFTNAVFCQR